jgi:indole-3-glycerol phosphate synthase
MPQTILQKILETKRLEVQALHRQGDLAALQAAAARAPRARNFFSAVTRASPRGMNLIAEVKKASPSAGVIREDFDPAGIARKYAAAGADALSVLTDHTYFQGDLEHLRAARSAVGLPVLRKDFLLDPWQVYESRAAGADAVLLIAAALRPGELLDLMILATELRMTVLVEVHEADELLQVRSMVGFPHRAYGLLGINNRDLATFRVDLGTTLRLAELAGGGVPLVSESGIRTRADVERLKAAGVKAVLVGETLMRAGDIAAAVEELLGPRHPAGRPQGPANAP